MTEAELIKWLNQVNVYDERIEAKIAEREELWTLATKVTGSMTGLPHGNEISDKVGNVAVKLRMLADETNALIDQYVDYKRQVIQTLEKLPLNEYAVLHRQYIRGMKIKDIAKDMGRSSMQISRYRKSGLDRLLYIVSCY